MLDVAILDSWKGKKGELCAVTAPCLHFAESLVPNSFCKYTNKASELPDCTDSSTETQIDCCPLTTCIISAPRELRADYLKRGSNSVARSRSNSVIPMAPRLWNQAGWCLAVFAMLLSSQMVMATSQSGNSGVRCSNSVCDDPSSYAPKNFIFVHGIGGGAWFWFEVITLLELYGFSATAVDLTSNGIDKAIADDVTTVAEYTKPLIDAIASTRGRVILVGHSLGGGSIAYASEKFPSKVSKAIYLSACTPSYNQSMFGAFPPTTFPNLVTPGYLSFNSANGSPTPTSASLDKNSLNKFYMNEAPKRYINLSKLLVTDTPYVPGTEVLPLTAANFGTVRRFYIRTGKDKGVSPADQDAMIAANPPEKVFCMPDGDHGVFFSAPLELVRLLTCISGQ